MTGRTLVAYHTKNGGSETYAKVIHDSLTGKGIDSTLVNLKKDTPKIEGFENIILGTGVKMFRVYGKWKKVLKQKGINDRNLFLFLSSGTAIEESPEAAVEKFLDPLIKKLGVKPLSNISFPGFIPEKWIKEGDDKDTVKPHLAIEWVEQIIGLLK